MSPLAIAIGSSPTRASNAPTRLSGRFVATATPSATVANPNTVATARYAASAPLPAMATHTQPTAAWATARPATTPARTLLARMDSR